MFAALKQLFASITALFVGTEHLAKAFVHTTAWAEDEAEGFRNKAAMQRAQATILMQAEFNAKNRELNITDDQIAANIKTRGPRALKQAA